MKIKNVHISVQLKIGLAILIFFAIFIGIIAFYQTDVLQQQTKTLYSHPLKVQRAIGLLNSDILSMRLGMRELLLAKTEEEKQAGVELMDLSGKDAEVQFKIIKEQYLGPQTNVDEAYQSFLKLKIMTDFNIRLALNGEIEKVRESLTSSGNERIQLDEVISAITVIDKFAIEKGDSLLYASQELKNSLNRRLIILVGIILVFSMIINFVLLRNIRTPVVKLTEATWKFQNGDMSARSNYSLKNEFGVLSDSFNSLAETIMENHEVDRKSSGLANIMLGEDDAKIFFQITLNALVEYTGSQMGAAYILSEDKSSYQHFSSIGLGENAKQSFSAESFEGEFGAALYTQKIQHLKGITDETRFIFNTVSGKFIPREIITIPIVTAGEVSVIISLARVESYEGVSLKLLDNILDMINARVEGVLAYRKIKEFAKKLESQNRELEAQKSELASQSSELMEQNAELEMQKMQLSEVSRLKTNFLSNMSHELRTPLNSVIALSGVLNRRLANKIPQEEHTYIEVIERNGKHLLELINDILDISRIEAGKEEIEINRFDLNNLVAEVVSMIHPNAKEKNIELNQLGGSSEKFLTSDPEKCRHILQNLISNAVKFTQKGKVEVSVSKENHNIIVKVSDTGIGISAENLPYIFDEFRQADGSTSRRFGGTGLGLAIARKYANLLGGNINVKSQLDIGSEFNLILPEQYDSEKMVTLPEDYIQTRQNLPRHNERIAMETSGKTILLVEDNEPAIIQIKDFLEEDGYRLLIAHNGSEALSIISATIPDAMIIDLMMPDIDGFELLKLLRNAEITAHIPVLVLTAKHITKEELKFLKRNKVYQLIQKGKVNREELKTSLTGMISSQKSEHYGADLPKRILEKTEKKPLVLVVEDNFDNMVTVKALLSEDFLVIEATDGITAVESAKKFKPDLILMDIAIPGMDGIEAFNEIRKDVHLQNISVIALTASAMVNERETILAHGFDAYIAKPIDAVDFYKIINETLYG